VSRVADASSKGGAIVARQVARHPHPTDTPVDAADLDAQLRELQATLNDALAQVQEAQDRVAYWEHLFDAISDPIGVVNADHHLVYANAAYRAMFGRIPDGKTGHECFSAHPNPSGGPCETCPVPAAIRSRRPAFVQSERRLPSVPETDGDQSSRRIFQRWTYPMIGPDGHIEEVVEMIKDVTEQERLRDAAREAEALRVADRLKAELLGTVSHELRSPLAAIKGYAGTLLRQDGRLPRAERHEFLTSITEASDRLEAIIDKLLLMSQLETGLVTLNRAPMDLRQLAREAVIGIERRLPHDGEAGRAQHQFVVVDAAAAETPESDEAVGAPPVIYGDRRLLRQVLDEVLDNAVKYSPDGGRIEVSLHRVRSNEGEEAPNAAQTAATVAPAMIDLQVRDEGLGIPNDHLGRVFDRFHRVNGSLTSEFGGLGLGLAICKRVIELHGGAVQVQSEPGQGTVFTLRLPLGTFGEQSEG
jgi:two-component system phosphate regulon sensor histidine kinase PhoR